MREKCQDELIESIREKQERTDSQLRNFREVGILTGLSAHNYALGIQIMTWGFIVLVIPFIQMSVHLSMHQLTFASNFYIQIVFLGHGS